MDGVVYVQGRCINMTKWKIDLPADVIVDRNGYTLGGKKYTRVTRTLGVISKPGLLVWYQNVGKYKAGEIIKNRQVLGTKVHKLFELTLQEKKFDLENYEEEIRTDVDMFIKFKDDTKLSDYALEQRLWSETYSYAGTSDYIGNYTSCDKYRIRGHESKFLKGGYVVGDWKSSKNIYPEYWLQLAAYGWAFYELTGIKLDGAFIAQFRFGKVRVEERTWDELMELFEIYKAALTLFKWKNKNG